MKSKLPESDTITRKGEAVSVILPIEVYHQMLRRLDDADDILWLKEARKKPQSFRNLEDVLADLGI